MKGPSPPVSGAGSACGSFCSSRAAKSATCLRAAVRCRSAAERPASRWPRSRRAMQPSCAAAACRHKQKLVTGSHCYAAAFFVTGDSLMTSATRFVVGAAAKLRSFTYPCCMLQAATATTAAVRVAAGGRQHIPSGGSHAHMEHQQRHRNETSVQVLQRPTSSRVFSLRSLPCSASSAGATTPVARYSCSCARVCAMVHRTASAGASSWAALQRKQ